MNTVSTVSKIYWPSHCSRAPVKSGFLVGWNSRSFTATVATVVSDTNLETLERTLLELFHSPIPPTATSAPIVLGVCLSSTDPPETISKLLSSSGITQKKQTANLWITLDITPEPYSLPKLRSVHCCGYSYHNLSSEIVIYRQPNTKNLQYLAFSPLVLDISRNALGKYRSVGANEPSSPIASPVSPQHSTPSSPVKEGSTAENKENVSETAGANATEDSNGSTKDKDDEDDEEDEEKKKKQQSKGGDWTLKGDGGGRDNMLRKIKGHSGVSANGGNASTGGVDDIQSILNQVNSSCEVEAMLKRHFKMKRQARSKATSSSEPATPSPTADAKPQLPPISTSTSSSTLLSPIRILFSKLFLIFLFTASLLSDLVLKILNYKFFPGGLSVVGAGKRFSGKDLSAAAQQVDLRLRQARLLPRMSWFMVQRRNGFVFAGGNTDKKTDQEDMNGFEKRQAEYISFYNTLWLIANDIILGVGLGQFLIQNSHWVAHVFVDLLFRYSVESIRGMLIWLMGWPAGLKLNSELDEFLGELFLWLIHLWTIATSPLLRLLPSIFHVIGLSGICGASMVFACLSDLLSISTLHIYLFYMVAAKIYYWQVNVIWSLFNLFRGKKFNVLRDRLDACDYDLDQLLLGTVLFTLLAFLFPTVAVYYVLFASSRVIVIVFQAILEIILAILNHFPLFAMMLRLKDPARLPGGLQFRPLPMENIDATQPTYDVTEEEFSSDTLFILTLLTHLIQTGKEQFGNIWEKIRNRNDEATSSSEQLLSSASTASLASVLQSGAGDDDGAINDDSSTVSAPMKRTGSNASLAKKCPTYLLMKNTPLRASSIYYQYSYLLNRLISHYFSSRLFKSLLIGEHLRPISRLQYPMLPDLDKRRRTVKQMWEEFWR